MVTNANVSAIPALPFTGMASIAQDEVAYAYPIGHGWAGTAPDIIANDPQKYKQYVMDLYRLLGGNPTTAKANAMLQQILGAADYLHNHSSVDENSYMEQLAHSSFGYRIPYSPNGGKIPIPFLDNLD